LNYGAKSLASTTPQATPHAQFRPRSPIHRTNALRKGNGTGHQGPTPTTGRKNR